MKLNITIATVSLLFCGLASCQNPKMAYTSNVVRENFQSTYDGKQTDLYYIRNANGIQIAVTNFGARVVELLTPDRNGVLADIVLGHDNIAKYTNFKGERFLGATIGRYGNRIANGKFTLNDVEYTLAQNNGKNTLHGGLKSFDMVVWDVKQINDKTLELSYVSPDMEEGFPGTLTVNMTYELTDDNQFKVTHRATTDRATPVNLTHHSFFNLAGEGRGTINNHQIMIKASNYIPVDSTLIPFGTIESVVGTPFDFLTSTTIGSRLGDSSQQLAFAGGYDHNWVLDRATENDLELAAIVTEPESGRTMEVWTTEPGIQFYGGNFFDGSIPAKNGGTYDYRGSLALETQHFPDSPNQPNYPSTILDPGQNYYHVCVYKFGTIN